MAPEVIYRRSYAKLLQLQRASLLELEFVCGGTASCGGPESVIFHVLIQAVCYLHENQIKLAFR